MRPGKIPNEQTRNCNRLRQEGREGCLALVGCREGSSRPHFDQALYSLSRHCDLKSFIASSRVADQPHYLWASREKISQFAGRFHCRLGLVLNNSTIISWKTTSNSSRGNDSSLGISAKSEKVRRLGIGEILRHGVWAVRKDHRR